MNIIPLSQHRYSKAVINAWTKKNEACVLACSQMAIQYRTNSVMFQDAFYEAAKKAGAITRGAYVNSYERLYGAYLRQASWITFRKPPNWVFSYDREQALAQVNNENPVLAFLGGHCILLSGYTATGYFLAIDPNIKDFETPIMVQKQIKRYGWWQL